MIEVDQISHGNVPVNAEVSYIQGLGGQGRYHEAASAILDYMATPEWAIIEEGALRIDGLVLPHSSWNLLMSILLQGYAFDVVALHIQRMFSVEDVIVARKDDDKPTIVDFHFNQQKLVVFLHGNVNQSWMWFAACRLIGILPMLMHVHRYRRGDGSVSISMLDSSSSGEPSFSSVSQDSVLLPDPIFVETNGYYALRRRFERVPPLRERNLKALWRGSTTGTRVSTWRTLPRAVLCQMSHNDPEVLDCGITSIVQFESQEEKVEMADSGLLKPMVSSEDYRNYAFHIDIDGNSNSWPGLFSKLLSGGAVFKVESVEGYRQWFYDRLTPWLHFIPVCNDMSDLIDKIKWARRNLDRVERIGRAGKDLAASMTLAHEMDYAVAAIEKAFV